jgi:hypothetical protein
MTDTPTTGDELRAYDAGLLGGIAEWSVSDWHDYIRSELARAHDFYADQFEALASPAPAGKGDVTSNGRQVLEAIANLRTIGSRGAREDGDYLHLKGFALEHAEAFLPSNIIDKARDALATLPSQEEGVIHGVAFGPEHPKDCPYVMALCECAACKASRPHPTRGEKEALHTHSDQKAARHDWPYQRTFDAIADAVEWREHRKIGISVEKFAKRFGPFAPTVPEGIGDREIEKLFEQWCNSGFDARTQDLPASWKSAILFGYTAAMSRARLSGVSVDDAMVKRASEAYRRDVKEQYDTFPALLPSSRRAMEAALTAALLRGGE